MIDYYGRARRQGASRYMASEFERYVTATLARGAKPLSCKAFLAHADRYATWPTGN